MLFVLDAGVFVSAVITPGGVAGHIVTSGVEGRFEYLLCPRLVGEISDVMTRAKITRRVKEGDRRAPRPVASARPTAHRRGLTPFGGSSGQSSRQLPADQCVPPRVAPSSYAVGVTEVGLKPLRELLEAHREEIKRIVASHHGRTVAVFGSVARGDETPGSDIDLLVDLEPGTRPFEILALGADLEDALGVKVDVGTRASLRERLRAEVLAEAIPL